MTDLRSGPPVRAAAVQFATTTDVEENLATCLRMIDAAGEESPDLVVLPEFANHLSVYESAEHCREVAVDLDGPFPTALGERAAALGIVLAVALTVRRPDRVTVSSLLWGSDGTLLAVGDKQTLMGNEREFLSAGDAVAAVTETDLGPIGIYACMDGVTPETPRALTVRGARILTNSLNSFALDEASLHIPVRAAENGVFVVAANKVGPLLPADRVGAFSEAMGLPASAFDGAGESQIVDPDGVVLAKGPRTGEAVVTAELVRATERDGEARRTGPDPVADRRPELFASLADPEADADRADAAEQITAVAVATADAAAIEAALANADLVVL
ncbi:MAG: carbon-nitrogen hydrolase family protein, partial [Actinomycetota bacterium]